MTGLPIALQAMVWVYALVAGGAILTCLWTMYAGLTTGRHRRRKSAVLVDLGVALANLAEIVIYGRPA